MIGLHSLAVGRRPSRKRVGRGHGSGLGTYAGKGVKGQRARSGGRRGLVRRSLKSLIERLPKVRGSHLTKTLKPVPVSLRELERSFDAGTRVTPELLIAKRLIPHRQPMVVILNGGTLSKPLTVEAHRFSAAARQAIVKAGGSIVILLPARPSVRRRPTRKGTPV